MISILTRRVILEIDRGERRRLGVFEFTQNPRCILRVAFEYLKKDCLTSGGFRLASGEKVLSIHLRNEYMPSFTICGSGLGWAKQFLGAFAESLGELQRFISSDPRCEDIRLIWGTILLFDEPGRPEDLKCTLSVSKGATYGRVFFFSGPGSFRMLWCGFSIPRRLRQNTLSRGRLYRVYWRCSELERLTLKRYSLS